MKSSKVCVLLSVSFENIRSIVNDKRTFIDDFTAYAKGLTTVWYEMDQSDAILIIVGDATASGTHI